MSDLSDDDDGTPVRVRNSGNVTQRPFAGSSSGGDTVVNNMNDLDLNGDPGVHDGGSRASRDSGASMDRFVQSLGQSLVEYLRTAGLQLPSQQQGVRPSSQQQAQLQQQQQQGQQPQLGVTGISLASGLDVRHVPRSDQQRATAGVLSKHDRGNTPQERLKREKAVVQSLSTKLACSNVMRLVMSDDLSKHDIAADCIQSQNGIQALRKVLIKNDMLAPFLVPSEFDVDDPTKTKGPFIDITIDPHLVPDDVAKRWQVYLSVHAAEVDIESCSWAAMIMDKSMESDLQALVHDDLADLSHDEDGAVVMFKYMSNHMVLRNQEMVDALLTWIRHFDVRQIDGQNISTACTQVRAVVRALDPFGLPGNALQSILRGFSRATTTEFQQLCAQLLTMSRSTLLSAGQSHMTAKRRILATLKDLEACFANLAADNRWDGIGHDGAGFRTALANNQLNEITTKRDSLKAMAARGKIPFEEWVKTKKCDHCGEVGHIKRDCPKLQGRRGKDNQAPRGGRSKFSRERERRYKKAYNAVIEALANDDSESESDAVDATSTGENGSVSDGSEGDDASLAAHAARVYMSLKE